MDNCWNRMNFDDRLGTGPLPFGVRRPGVTKRILNLLDTDGRTHTGAKNFGNSQNGKPTHWRNSLST